MHKNPEKLGEYNTYMLSHVVKLVIQIRWEERPIGVAEQEGAS
jgi:hypothetical protein